MLAAPVCGSCLPLTASSFWAIVMLKPAWATLSKASATPLAVGTPLGASPPVIGSSMPILIVDRLMPVDAAYCRRLWRR